MGCVLPLRCFINNLYYFGACFRCSSYQDLCTLLDSASHYFGILDLELNNLRGNFIIVFASSQLEEYSYHDGDTTIPFTPRDYVNMAFDISGCEVTSYPLRCSYDYS